MVLVVQAVVSTVIQRLTPPNRVGNSIDSSDSGPSSRALGTTPKRGPAVMAPSPSFFGDTSGPKPGFSSLWSGGHFLLARPSLTAVRISADVPVKVLRRFGSRCVQRQR